MAYHMSFSNKVHAVEVQAKNTDDPIERECLTIRAQMMRDTIEEEENEVRAKSRQ